MTRDEYARLLRVKGRVWAQVDLCASDLALLGRALSAYEEALDGDMLTAQTEEERDQLFYEKRDTRKMGEWLAQIESKRWVLADRLEE
jgi:hypothetical protein